VLFLSLLIALLPVLLFLLVLVVMDSFKLVPFRTVVFAIASGVLAAAVCLTIHHQIIASGMTTLALKRYIAPFTEETAKALFIVWLLARRRLGFAVDAAITGFAVGAGFAVAENVDYLWTVSGARIWVWIVRGLGTAILHGATTSLFAMIARSMSERHSGRLGRALAAGWLTAVAVHGAYNNMLLPPIAATLVLLIVLPVIIVVVFRRSEQATRDWVTGGLDLDLELLQLISSDDFAHTRFGAYLHDLKTRMSGPIVADMFCLLRLDLELAIQAKAMLLAREAGMKVTPDDDLRASLAEVRYLETSIGRTGLLALGSLQIISDRDRWHRYLLEKGGRGDSGARVATERRP
jgi:RsiW-degrading membrane proteinase PrsW (M82 family)